MLNSSVAFPEYLYNAFWGITNSFKAELTPIPYVRPPLRLCHACCPVYPARTSICVSLFFYSVASLLVPALETLQLLVLFDPRLALHWCAGQSVRSVVAGAPSATEAGFSAF
jgi:hypothetical protein